MEVTFWTVLVAFVALQAHCKLLGPRELPVFIPKHLKNQDWSKMTRNLPNNNSSRPPWMQPR